MSLSYIIWHYWFWKAKKEDESMKTVIKKGQCWVYKQSLRTYVVLEAKDGDVVYTAATISPAFGKKFKTTRTDFIDRFVLPEAVTDEVIKAAVENTLKHYGLMD